MKKIVAIVTQNGSLSKGLHKNATINLFKLEDEHVTEVENLSIDDDSLKSFSLLMALKRVSIVYIGSIGNDVRHVLHMIGITIKSQDEQRDDQFIKHFIFD